MAHVRTLKAKRGIHRDLKMLGLLGISCKGYKAEKLLSTFLGEM